ncbi:fucosyl transferase, variant [Loa loa]|uniref:Fucosyltransferase n=1 Tax=Loa loa TaxID=7209 RepID=A0A1S0UJ90_LOALO|nr:fucosyl transferase [Loa loa]XP_020305779.1 fucosyl transferase, variant [Loa loa]EFO21676.2 fucosyl transferase [Loa loa]EJD74884.1 fucosyl transferase, variant [Loa loa]
MKLQWLKLGLLIVFIISIVYLYPRWRILNDMLIFERVFHTTKLDRTSLSPPLILAWTRFFSHPWAQRIKHDVSNCGYNCTITDDKEQLSEAVAVLFHIRDLEVLPQSRNPKQLFVFVLHESPLYTFNYLDLVADDYFNITMTYRHDSDIYIPYGMMKKITNITPSEQIWNWSEVVKIASAKVRPVLQLVSNCQTRSKREFYVEELRTYIPITQHGRCNNSTCDEECEVKEAAQHRFYLAFENSICRDYITEKLFKCLVRLLVPIVLKKSIYEGILPPRSFIAADDFTSPRELAEYLQYLSNNSTAYLSYFEWTRHYQKTFGVSSYCELCKYLHRGIARPRIIPNIKKWWFQGCIQDYAVDLLKRAKIMGLIF